MELLSRSLGRKCLSCDKPSLKKGCVLTLLRSLYPNCGPVNVAKYIVQSMKDNISFLRTAADSHKDTLFVLVRVLSDLAYNF